MRKHILFLVGMLTMMILFCAACSGEEGKGSSKVAVIIGEETDRGCNVYGQLRGCAHPDDHVNRSKR